MTRTHCWPRSLLTSTPTVLVVTRQLGVKSVNELVAYAMKNPGKPSFGGIGSSAHLSLELFNTSAGVKITSITYPGSLRYLQGPPQGYASFVREFESKYPKVKVRITLAATI